MCIRDRSTWGKICIFEFEMAEKGATNAKLTGLLTEMVTEKAIEDKTKQYVEEQTQEYKQQQQQGNQNDKKDSDDDFEMDEEELKIIQKLKQERLREVEQHVQKEQKIQFPGEYREITEEEFLPYVTKNEYVACHFYHRDFERCKIVDQHLRILAQQHPECKFLNINAEKAPFFVSKLAVKTLPTICLFKDGILQDSVVGFGDLGERDDFKTIELARRLLRTGIIKPRTDAEKGFKLKRGTNSGNNNDDSDSD
eukprot:TRINITY_DN694_c0_g1_i4.p1 TRINITY_DN694_c0_g1~~TRINITY_DN694_c0_g1_i4.p1  ORF type:complete len:253 (-),score=53.35 TRINITY_DN694_c0_g1_i4:175-933(-)